MVLRCKTLVVNVPNTGVPVPLLMQTSRSPFVIRASEPVRIGSQDSLSPSTGLLLQSGDVFGMTAADYDDIPYSQLYVCAAENSAGGTITGICWERE